MQRVHSDHSLFWPVFCLCIAWNRWSLVYVYAPAVRMWMSLCLTQDTFANKVYITRKHVISRYFVHTFLPLICGLSSILLCYFRMRERYCTSCYRRPSSSRINLTTHIGFKRGSFVKQFCQILHIQSSTFSKTLLRDEVHISYFCFTLARATFLLIPLHQRFRYIL